MTIELRADSGFATPRLYTSCEAAGIASTIGLATNARLQALAAPQRAQAQQAAAELTVKVRLVGAVE